MAGRRFIPLVVCVLIGSVILIARLFQVQILEREIWADQAATLVRAGNVRPYRRGSILDRAGREIAHDERGYRVQMSYRDFRREHPLGMVAHARSSLLGRPIELAEALQHLPEWAGELITLTPGQLEAFARGGELAHGTLQIAASGDPESDDRQGRRGDVRFYATQLFELERPVVRELMKRLRKEPQARLIDLAASASKRSVETLLGQLETRLLACSENLEGLARRIDADEESRDVAEAPLDRIVARLEAWRADVEDDSASELFREAAGFSAGRIEPDVAAYALDLRWLSAALRWDEARTGQWLTGARAAWLDSTQRGRVERWLVELELGEREGPLARRILERWRQPFVADDEGLVVLDQLEALFAGVDVEGREAALLAFEDERVEAAEFEGPAAWSTLARLELGWDAPEAEVGVLAAAWAAAFDEDFDAAFLRERTLAVLAGWETQLQNALRLELDALVDGARDDGELAPRLEFSEGRLDRAAERSRYVLKDRGSRPSEVLHRPTYATVHLLTRHPERFRGFRVVEASERIVARDVTGRALAPQLIGSVAAPTWRDQLLESELRKEFERLRGIGTRSADEQRELEWLAPRVARADEERGNGGVEGYCDRELAGTNGYSEQRGLQDEIDRRAELGVAPRDGSDVVLTLDLALQRAAREVLADPEGAPAAELRDYEWLANPTGAIVLLTPRGDVLAAASYPDFARGEAEPRATRDQPFERTLRKPTFQPPGSVFKPFVAAWALDHVAFDPERAESCVFLAELDSAGYVDVRCASTWGHGAVDLRDSLKRSCNSYFARLGERFTHDDWRGLAREFGFGEPTGVRAFGARRGLMEDVVPSLFERELEGRDPRLAANGLALVEATPMQIARAFAALASGELADVRLIARVGEREIERKSRPLALSPAALERVRTAMKACAGEDGGSAHEALSQKELGMTMAAKTGSGDIGERKQATADGKARVRKHTWLAGWLPAEEPKLIVVVFVHDTVQTASHGAIWLARQLLLREEVRSYLAEAGQ